MKKTKVPSKNIKAKKSVLRRPSTWIVSVLALALIVVSGLLCRSLNTTNEMDVARLEHFDHFANVYIDSLKINGERDTKNYITGYGISDEDGVFYVTFDYFYVDEVEDRGVTKDDMKHAIIYLWPSNKKGYYSQAFGYYEDSYRPSGKYVKVDSVMYQYLGL